MLDFDLRDRTILLTVAGSRAYGMHTAESDLDVKGILVPPAKYYLGTKSLEQVEDAAEIQKAFLYDLTDEQRDVADQYGMEGTRVECVYPHFVSVGEDALLDLEDHISQIAEDVQKTANESSRV